jgi:hypothetical protein
MVLLPGTPGYWGVLIIKEEIIARKIQEGRMTDQGMINLGYGSCLCG